MLRLFLAAMGALASSQCLPGASTSLKQLKRGTEEFPVGLWVNDYPAGHATAQMVFILIQEVLGFQVEVKGSGQSSLDGFFAVSGCRSPNNVSDRGCGAEKTYVHVNVEAWEEGYKDALTEMRATMPLAPKSLGNMGYYGYVSMYIPSQPKDLAYESEGLSLEFYREYNSSWNDISKYFSGPMEVNTSRLLPCSETLLMDSKLMADYQRITGDREGVVVQGNSTRGKCFDGFFWYAPSCRHDASKCSNLFTGGNGWGLGDFMQKTAWYNMPISLAVAATFHDFSSLPEAYTSLLYWWVPDVTYLRLMPQKVVFPPHSVSGWAVGDFRTVASDLSIEKHVSQDLSILAPTVEAMLRKLSIDLTMVDSMLVDWMDSADPWEEVACRWLRAHPIVWQAWIPDRSECFAGFGMYDEGERRFILEHVESHSVGCRVCPEGHYSEQLSMTHICRKCPPGSIQASAASQQCEPCPAGEFQDQPGQSSCQRCLVGFYQNMLGQEMCKTCPAGTSTIGLASLSVADCGCERHTINTAENASSFKCRPCSKGLHCPLLSSVIGLQKGQAALGAEAPMLMRGYYSTQAQPLSVWQCKAMTRCPGGQPGTCLGGLEGIACSRCPEGQIFTDECRDCPAHAWLVWWAVLLLALVGLVVTYYVMKQDLSPHLTPLKAVLLSVTIAIKYLQSLGAFGMMALLWSPGFQEVSGVMKGFLLDAQSLGMPCIVGTEAWRSYLLTAILWPGALLWLLLVYSVTQLFSFAWKGSWLRNAMGKVCDAGFGAFSALALKPLMCYAHPNGLRSLLHHNDVVCGEQEHLTMVIFGALLGSLVLGFFASCCYAAWHLPSWSSGKQTERVQSCRFLYADFRLDIWWFGLLLLFRNLGFSCAIVLAMDLAPAQAALASVIILVYLAVQASAKPWKAPLINTMDTCLSVGLVLLLRHSGADRVVEEQFNQLASTVALAFIFGCLALPLGFSLASLLLTRCGLDGSRLLLARPDPRIAEETQRVAEELLRMEAQHLREGLKTLNWYDVQNLVNTIVLVSTLQPTDQSSILGQDIRLRVSVLLDKVEEVEFEEAEENEESKGKDEDGANDPEAAFQGTIGQPQRSIFL